MNRILRFIIACLYTKMGRLYLSSHKVRFILAAARCSARIRPVVAWICARLGYDVRRSFRPIIPTISVSELVGGDISIVIHEPWGAFGNAPLHDVIVVSLLARTRCPACIFEMGTFDGRTSLNMAVNCPRNARIYTIDMENVAPRYAGTEYEARITKLHGNTQTFDFGPFFNTIDFIFADASHSYEDVLRDSATALRLLKNGGGAIMWHDYGTWEGTTNALNQLYLQNPAFKGLRHVKGTSLACLIND